MLGWGGSAACSGAPPPQRSTVTRGTRVGWYGVIVRRGSLASRALTSLARLTEGASYAGMEHGPQGTAPRGARDGPRRVPGGGLGPYGRHRRGCSTGAGIQYECPVPAVHAGGDCGRDLWHRVSRAEARPEAGPSGAGQDAEGACTSSVLSAGVEGTRLSLFRLKRSLNALKGSPRFPRGAA